MGRYSDDSDSESGHRKKGKKKKSRRCSRSKSRGGRRSRSRNRRSGSRSRRSKSRSHSRRSRDDRTSRSRDKRSKEHHRRRSRSRSRDSSIQRDRRSKNRSRSRGSSSRSRTRQSDPSPPPAPVIGPETMLTIAEELKRARAIADIESESFVQKGFQTNYNKAGVVEEDGKFDFGTSAEKKSKTEAEEAMEKLNREGLFHPMLFGDQEKREKRFLLHVWTIRQKAVKALQEDR